MSAGSRRRCSRGREYVATRARRRLRRRRARWGAWGAPGAPHVNDRLRRRRARWGAWGAPGAPMSMIGYAGGALAGGLGGARSPPFELSQPVQERGRERQEDRDAEHVLKRRF